MFSKWQICLLFIASVLAVFFRIYQLEFQVVTDDEWHAVFRTADLTLSQAFTSFGHADHSIPLLLYDKFITFWAPLNEFWLRLPSVLAGFLFLIFLPFYAYRHVSLENNSLKWVSVFLFVFIATSPLLIAFSRMARPYMLSIFFSYFAHASFHAYWKHPNARNLTGFALSAMLSTWLLLLSGFFVIAPFFYVLPELYRNFKTDRTIFIATFKKIFIIGLAYSILTLIVLLPPLIQSSHQLGAKSGQHLPLFTTYIDVFYVWYGSQSTLVVIGLGFLSVLGIKSAWKLAVFRTALLGCALILISIYISRPAWVIHPLTFGRYVLPMLPVLLISMSFGLYVVVIRLNDKLKTFSCFVVGSVIVFTSLLLQQFIVNPSYGLTGYYMMSPRNGNNIVKEIQDKRSYSDFWQSPKLKQDDVVLLAPFYFTSYNWDGVVIERLSHNRIVPAFVNGFCAPSDLIGEPSFQSFQANKIRLSNGVYLGQYQSKNEIKEKVDWFVWQKAPERPPINRFDFTKCDRHVIDFFGSPDYEDEFIQVFKL